MRASWLMRFWLALLLLLGFSVSVYAAPSAEGYGVLPTTQASCPTNNGYSWVKLDTTQSLLISAEERWGCKVPNSNSYSNYSFLRTCVMSAMASGNSCVCHSASGAFYKSTPSPTGSCGCPTGKEINLWNKQCVTPCPTGQNRVDPDGHCEAPPLVCNSPKIEVNGACACPEGTVASGEACIKPDCAQKQQTCSTGCGGVNGDMSAVAYFYCESTIDSGSTSIVFSDDTYKCECAQTTPGCPTGQIGITATKDGAITCGNPKNPGCPDGSFYGDFNGKTGCIKPDEHNDPDETPKNCVQGTGGVYFGSTLYCVPQPNSDTTCPTGTASFITDTGLKVCKGTDPQGNSTGDSPDTNGSIKGVPTGSGSGTGGTGGEGGSGSGSGSGDGTGAYDAQMAAKLGEIKNNTDTMKASAAQAAGNTQATANNTFKTEKNTAGILDALTGSASNTAKGSFTQAITQLNTEVETLKTQYGSTLTSVKNQMTGFLSTVAAPTGVGALPCYPSVHVPVLNIDFALCFTQFEEALRIIGTYIYGIAFLFAGLIILGSSRGEG